MSRWVLKKKGDQDKISSIQEQLNIEFELASILVRRGFDEFEKARQFFNPSTKDLHDPFLMLGMNKAVERLSKAVFEKEKIIIYGDYDVDGTTSVSILFDFLQFLEARVTMYIPDRYDEGYGISSKGIDFAKEQECSLFISVDCGIRAIDLINDATADGIDFIICDHHIPADKLPNAHAILDPKQADCAYPYDELCGCGIVWKLIQAMTIHHGMDPNLPNQYLDLLAIAIGADIVPITGENRILAHFGLALINSENQRESIKSMLDVAKIDSRKLTISDLVFVLAPRINAAGRMDHAMLAVDLLLEKDFQKAKVKSERIEKLNIARKSEDKRVASEALALIDPDAYSTVVSGKDWHKGVVGIVASKLIDKHYRPTIVMSEHGGELTGSARSIKGINIHSLLKKCSASLLKFGGHAMAAGLSLDPNNFESFKAQFELVAKEEMNGEKGEKIIDIDEELVPSQINKKNYLILQRIAPFGPSNSNPTFLIRDTELSERTRLIGGNQEHLKVQIGKQGSVINGVGFGLGKKWVELKDNHDKFDLAFQLIKNDWRGKSTIEISLKDIRPSQP